MIRQITTSASSILFALHWLYLITFGLLVKKGGSSGGGGGGGVSWANDLAGSNNSHQWVAAISGGGGLAGSVPVANATFLTFVRTGDPTTTNALVNFPGVNTTQMLSIRDHGDTTDLSVIRSTGAGEATVFGDNATGLQDTWLLGDSLSIFGRSQTNEIRVGASVGVGVIVDVGTSQVILTEGLGSILAVPFVFDAASPIIENAYVEFVPATSPASPANSVLIGKASSTGVGTVVSCHSDANMDTVLAPNGDTAREFIDRVVKSALAVAGSGGTSAVTYTPGRGNCTFEALVTCMGTVAGAGFRETATATVTIDAGVAALVAAAAGSSNPKVNGLLDQASDAAFTNGVTPSSIALTVVTNSLRVTVTNQGALANDFAIFFEIKGFTT